MPFTLTHPKPEPVVESPRENAPATAATVDPPADEKPIAQTNKNSSDQTVPVDVNLIEFETRFVFFYFMKKSKC